MLPEITGHVSITTTPDLSGHLYPGDMDRYTDGLDAVVDEASKAKIGLDRRGQILRMRCQVYDPVLRWRARRDSNPSAASDP